MKKGNAFDALLEADPDAPLPPVSAATNNKKDRVKMAGFRHGIVCGAWHSGQVLVLLHRNVETKNWTLALLTDKINDQSEGRSQALALLLTSAPINPAPTFLEAPPMKENGTLLHFAVLSSALLANQQLHFRTTAAAANLFSSNPFQLAALNEATARYLSMAPAPSALPVVSFDRPASAQPPAGRMLVLCGLPGSGKSTFSALMLKSMSGWLRICQDELGNRQACEAMVDEALGSGHHVLIDRCNFNAQQRRTWLNLAAKWNCSRVEAVYLQVPVSECVRRVQQRENHPTLKPGEEATAVVTDFAKNFVPPLPREGFAHVYMLTAGDDPAQVIDAIRHAIP